MYDEVREEGSTLPEDSVPLRSTPAPPIVSCVPAKAGTCIQRAPPPARVRGWTRLREGISLPPWFGTAEGSLPGLFVPCRVLKHGSGNDMRPKRSHRRAGAKHEKEDDLKSFGLFGHPLYWLLVLKRQCLRLIGLLH